MLSFITARTVVCVRVRGGIVHEQDVMSLLTSKKGLGQKLSKSSQMQKAEGGGV